MKTLYRIIITLLACVTFSVAYATGTTDSVANYDDQIMLISEDAADEVAEEVPAVVEEMEENLSITGSLSDFFGSMGISKIIMEWGAGNWRYLVMIAIGCLLLYLAIVKQFEPLLLLPIAMGMILTNLPDAGMFHSELFAGGHVHWAEMAENAGLLDYLYLGVKLGIYPCLIFFQLSN